MDPTSMLCLGLSLWALKRTRCISPQNATPRLTNKKRLGTSLKLAWTVVGSRD